MHQSDLPPRERPNDGTSDTAKIPIAVEMTPTGMGSEAAEEIREQGGVDARHSPFYEWLDNTAIQELVHRIHELSAGERLVLIKGLVPGLVSAMGLAEFDAYLSEISIKARRFQEAVDHPGEGRELRVTRGEELGGPTPAGHDHLPTARDPNHRGAREAERVTERDLWARGDHVSALPHGSQ